MPDKDFTDAILDMAKGSPTTARELALVLAEREACARVADAVREANRSRTSRTAPSIITSVAHDTAAHIAQEIRARGDRKVE